MENTLTDSTRHYPPAEFGDTLRRRRVERGLGLRAAARAAGLSPGYLSMLEHGHRSPSESVAEALVGTLRLTGDDAETVLSAAIPGVGRDWTEPPPVQTHPRPRW
jgi:transcriptional regulator with XRE-family HTH domain